MSTTTTPKEKIDTLRRMYGEGASYLDIADAIGATKNAVAGLVSRNCRDIQRSGPVSRKVTDGVKETIEQRIDRVRASYEELGSFRKVARQLHIRQSEVSEIVSKRFPDLIHQKAKEREAQRSANSRAVSVSHAGAVSHQGPRPLPTPVRLAASNPVPFPAATGCPYPLWAADAAFEDKRVCNAGCEAGRSFCPSHHQLVYVPANFRRAA